MFSINGAGPPIVAAAPFFGLCEGFTLLTVFPHFPILTVFFINTIKKIEGKNGQKKPD